MLRVLLLVFLVFSFGYAEDGEGNCTCASDEVQTPYSSRVDTITPSGPRADYDTWSCLTGFTFHSFSKTIKLSDTSYLQTYGLDRYTCQPLVCDGNKTVDTSQSPPICIDDNCTSGYDENGTCIDECTQPDTPYPIDENNATYGTSEGNGDCELQGGFTESSIISCNTNYRCKFPDENSTQCPILDENGTCVPNDDNSTDDNSTCPQGYDINGSCLPDTDGDGIPDFDDLTPNGGGGADDNDTCIIGVTEDIPFPPKDETKFLYTTEYLSLCEEQNGTLQVAKIDCEPQTRCERPINQCNVNEFWDTTALPPQCKCNEGMTKYLNPSNGKLECQIGCPSGYALINGICTLEDTNVSCQNGYININGICTLEDTNSSCESGYIKINGICTLDNNGSCQLGYEKNQDGICTLKEDLCTNPHEHTVGTLLTATCVCDVGYERDDFNVCRLVDINSTCVYPPDLLGSAFKTIVNGIDSCTALTVTQGGENTQIFDCQNNDYACYFNIKAPDYNTTCYYLDTSMGLAFKTLVSSLTECNTLSGSLPYSVYEAVQCEKPYACYYGDVNNTTPPTTDNNTTTGGTVDSNTTPPTTDNNTTPPTTDNNTTNLSKDEQDEISYSFIEKFEVFSEAADNGIASIQLMIDDVQNIINGVQAPIINVSGSCSLSFVIWGKKVDWKPYLDSAFLYFRPFFLFFLNLIFVKLSLLIAFKAFQDISSRVVVNRL